MGTGLRGKLAWKEVEVKNNLLGKPEMVLSGKARTLAKKRGVKRIFLSLSHTKELAQASVILES